MEHRWHSLDEITTATHLTTEDTSHESLIINWVIIITAWYFKQPISKVTASLGFVHTF